MLGPGYKTRFVVFACHFLPKIWYWCGKLIGKLPGIKFRSSCLFILNYINLSGTPTSCFEDVCRNSDAGCNAQTRGLAVHSVYTCDNTWVPTITAPVPATFPSWKWVFLVSFWVLQVCNCQQWYPIISHLDCQQHILYRGAIVKLTWWICKLI